MLRAFNSNIVLVTVILYSIFPVKVDWEGMVHLRYKTPCRWIQCHGTVMLTLHQIHEEKDKGTLRVTLWIQKIYVEGVRLVNE